MKKFVFLYVGSEESADNSTEAWTKWFESLGSSIVDSGNPFGAGVEVTGTGAKELPMDKDSITGYSIVNAANLEEAKKLLEGCPLTSGIRIYEAMPM